jgi:hypothetical protein
VVSQGFTRHAVEEYLRAMSNERIDLEAAIAGARARLERATFLERRLQSLEQRVGEWVVLSLALQRREVPLDVPTSSVASGDRAPSVPAGGAAERAGDGPASPRQWREAHQPRPGEVGRQAIERLEQLHAHLEQLRVALRSPSPAAPASESRHG